MSEARGTELVRVQGTTGADFAGRATHDSGDGASAIAIVLRGTADHAALEALDRLLGRVHAEARTLGARTATVDLRELEFMNSSCFKSFVTWITDILELAPAQQYPVRFHSNPAMHWQKRSLHSLRCFAPELVTVVEG